MKRLITFLIMLFIASLAMAQEITFDGQGYTNNLALGNPYTIVDNGETFEFNISGTSGSTNNIYRTFENSCGSSGLSHIYAGNISATTWTISTQSGNEINLSTIRFDNVFPCFSFSYSLTLEGFKNNTSTGTQSFTVSGLDTIFTSNSNFDDVDTIVITSADLGNLGIDNINWTASTLSVNENSLENNIKIYPNPTTEFIQISNIKTAVTYTIYDISGKRIQTGKVFNSNRINTKQLTNGIYFLMLDNQNAIKFIKQ